MVGAGLAYAATNYTMAAKFFVGNEEYFMAGSNASGAPNRMPSVMARFDYTPNTAYYVGGSLYLGRNTLLANRAWFDTKPFASFEWIDVDPAEPHAANALAIADTVVFPASFAKTRAKIESAGFHVTPLDISELQKAESGLTCSSLIFKMSSVPDVR